MLACDVNLFVGYIFGLEALSFPLYFEIAHWMRKTFADGKNLKGDLVSFFLLCFSQGFEKHFQDSLSFC